MFMNHHRIDNNSLAIKRLIKLGLQTDLLIRGVDTTFNTSLELETMIDKMTPEQKERLYYLLDKEFGPKRIAEMRNVHELK